MDLFDQLKAAGLEPVVVDEHSEKHGNWYLWVIGPYDQSYFGPFKSEAEATIGKLGVPNRFDAYVISQKALDDHFTRYGSQVICGPLDLLSL